MSGRPGVFLERRSYRVRRMMDALKILPVVGLMLWMLPLFWPSGAQTEARVSTSVAVTYVFVVWVLLIGAAFALSVFLRHRLSSDAAADDTRGDP